MKLEDVNPEDISSEDFSDSLSNKVEMEEAMRQLTAEQQAVLDLRIIKGYSAAETARLMKKREGTIRVIQYRAVKALAKLLEERGL